jgi:hypothetical protein
VTARPTAVLSLRRRRFLSMTEEFEACRTRCKWSAEHLPPPSFHDAYESLHMLTVLLSLFAEVRSKECFFRRTVTSTAFRSQSNLRSMAPFLDPTGGQMDTLIYRELLRVRKVVLRPPQLGRPVMAERDFVRLKELQTADFGGLQSGKLR